MRRVMIVAVCACLAMAAFSDETEIPGTGGIPDLTRGGGLTRVNLRWAGPLGIYCGSWRPRGQKMEDVRQLQVLQIEEGSPADGILQIDDVILGADGTGAGKVPLFKGAGWAMIPIADAITEAEAHDPALLRLLIWRPVKKNSHDKAATSRQVDLKSVSKLLTPYTEGETMTVTIQLQSLGRYSETAPYNCEKSKRILRQGIKALYESNDPGKAGLGILCLLAADDPTNPDNAKHQARAKEWAYKLMEKEDLSPWFSGPQLIVLSEYYMKTKDEAVFPALVRQAEKHARGVSWFGTTGHKWADKKPDGSDGGRLSGYGPINCSGALGFLGLSLARKAGVQSEAVDAANERQRIFFGHYASHNGGIGYGEMPYGIGGGTEDPNGRHGLPGLALGLQENQEAEAKFFAGMSAVSGYHTRLYAHGGPFFGQVWSPIAAGQGGPRSANLKFQEIRWNLDLKRYPDGSRIHDPTHQKYNGFCNGATALIFYALPLKNLYITGKGQKQSLQLSDPEFEELAACKNFNAGEASDEELIAALSRFQGMRRGTAAGELSDRIKADPESAASVALVNQLLAQAADLNVGPIGRTGACKVFQFLMRKTGSIDSERDTRIVKTMVALLKDPDPYIRFAGVRVLQTFHPKFTQVAVRPYANDIMDAIIATDRPTFPLNERDPVQWAHGEMGAFLFGTVLVTGLDGVDRTKLIPALRSSLNTPNASARNTASRVLHKLTMEEARELADVLVDNIKVAPPANAMGGSAEPACQKVLADHLFEEALPLSLVYGANHAVKNKIPQRYGRAAFTMQSSRDLVNALGKLMLVDASLDSYEVLEEMKEAPAPGEMRKLKLIAGIKASQATLALPKAETLLTLDATNYGVREESGTTYTWRKVYGAGKVKLTPNASGQSKKTTVSFTDRKPGTYRFEVTMSDALGYNELSETINITLYDKNGKLPPNQSPKAHSQSLEAVPGLPLPVTLSGTDPDGDELGFNVTKAPAHGRLSGAGSSLVYTADFGFNGTDRFTFDAIDGQGKTDTGTVSFKVSDEDVGVVAYEGFDYSAGAIHGRGGYPSFGFKGPWTNIRGTKEFYLVDTESLDRPDGLASLSYPELPSTGGRLRRGKGWWPVSRPLDTGALSVHRLLDNGNELWFSMFVSDAAGNTFFELAGPDISFGFCIKSQRSELHTILNGEVAGEANNPFSRSASLRYIDGPNLIIGRCIWAETDAGPDTVEIYRVFHARGFGPMVLEDPVCKLNAVIPQATINKISIKDFERGGVDEIRIGPTMHSVMVGTRPMGQGERSSQRQSIDLKARL